MTFEEAVEIVLEMEGGYVNDPHDPGGETNFGISKRAYPDVEIKELTREHAKFLYEKDYWMPLMPMGLPAILRLALFDSAVNQGVGWAVKALQKIVGTKIDGIMGGETLKAISNFDDIELLEKFLIRRIDAYLSIKGFDRYGHGWLRRLIHVSVQTQRHS